MRTRSVIHLSAALALIAGALLLAACGGGGSGSSAPTARPLTALSADNAPETVRSVAMALAGGEDILDGGLIPLSVDGGSEAGTTGSSPLEALQEITAQVRGKLVAGTSVTALSLHEGDRIAAQESFSDECELDGSFTYTESDTAISLVFNNCLESAYEGGYVRLNGRVDVSNTTENLGENFEYFSATIRFQQLTAEFLESLETPPVETVSIDGRVNVQAEFYWEDEPDGFRMYGDYLKFVVNDFSVVYSAFDIRVDDYWDSGYLEYDYAATLDISTLAGSIHVTTLEPVNQDWADAYPKSGKLRLDASNNGYLLFTINNSSGDSAVSIEADFNGDGIADCQEDISWEQVESADWVCNPV